MFNNFGNSPCFSGSYNGYGMPYSTGGRGIPLPSTGTPTFMTSYQSAVTAGSLLIW